MIQLEAFLVIPLVVIGATPNLNRDAFQFFLFFGLFNIILFMVGLIYGQLREINTRLQTLQ